MIAIALDDCACVAVGEDDKNVCRISTDLVWTEAGWIIADISDSGALREAHRSFPFGTIVGLQAAMEGFPNGAHSQAQGDFRLHFLAALFKRAAEALQAIGDPLSTEVAIALPSAAVRWMGPPRKGTAQHFIPPEPVEVVRVFQRAAQLAGFQTVTVIPAARCLFEVIPGRDGIPQQLQNRAAIVEVFRTGFSIVPVGAGSTTWPIHGRPLWIDHDVETWAVRKVNELIPGQFDANVLAQLIHAAVGASQGVRIPESVSGTAARHELSLACLVDPSKGDARIAGVPDRVAVVSALRHPTEDVHFKPQYESILLSGWLTSVPLVYQRLASHLQAALHGEGFAQPPDVHPGGALAELVRGVRQFAGKVPQGAAVGSAESVALTRGTEQPKGINAQVKTNSEDRVLVTIASRPAIGRLSWLVDGGGRTAIATLQRGDQLRHYRIDYQLQLWESRARVEVEAILEKDDRILLATLVDGRPAPAQVTVMGSNALIPAVAPGRFELYLDDEHELVSKAARAFARGPQGVIARFDRTSDAA